MFFISQTEGVKMEIVVHNRRKFHGLEIGIVLLLFSRQFANVARYAIMRDIPWITEILLLASLLLIIDWGNLRLLRFEGWNFVCTFYFLYVIYVGILAGPNAFQMPGLTNYIYVLFVLPILFVFATNKEFDFAFLLRAGFYATTFLALALLFIITHGFTELKNINQICDANGVLIADRATLSGIGSFGAAFLLTYRPHTKTDIAALCFTVPALVVDLILLNRRSVFLIIAAYFVLLLVYEFRNIKFRLRYLWIACGGLAVIAVILLCSEELRKLLRHSILTMFNAIMTFLGIDAGALDPANLERILAQQKTFATIAAFGFKEALFGIGMGGQIDYPLLQSLRDGGVIGLCAFCYVGVFLPIRYLGAHRGRGIERFLCFMMIMNFLGILYTGTPYNFLFHLPVILAAFVFERKRPLRLGLHYEKDPLY